MMGVVDEESGRIVGRIDNSGQELAESRRLVGWGGGWVGISKKSPSRNESKQGLTSAVGLRRAKDVRPRASW